MQNTYEKILGFTDDTYTTSVDNGDYQNFVHDKAGYGIAQWTYWSRKQNLQKYAQEKGASIGDLEMQLEFLIQELSSSYKSCAERAENSNERFPRHQMPILLKF